MARKFRPKGSRDKRCRQCGQLERDCAWGGDHPTDAARERFLKAVAALVRCPTCGFFTDAAADGSVPFHETPRGTVCHGRAVPLGL